MITTCKKSELLGVYLSSILEYDYICNKGLPLKNIKEDISNDGSQEGR